MTTLREDEILSDIPKRVEEEIKPHIRRNMVTSMADGGINAIATGMIPLQTIIVYFISGYVHSNLLIGLLSTVQLLFMAIPQLITAKRLDGMGYFKRLMGTLVIVSRTQSLIIGLLILFIAPSNKTLFVILFYTVYWLNGFVLGSNSITYSVFINKVIPFNMRGRFFGIRGIVCSVGSIIGSVVCGIIISKGDYSSKYAYLFLLSFVIDLVSFIFIIAAFEPRTPPNKQISDKNENFKNKVGMIVKCDKNLMKYIIALSMIMFAISTMAFETLYAKASFGLTTEKLSIMNVLIFVFQSLGYFLWGLLVDRFGFKVGMVGGYSMFILNLVLAAFVNNSYIIFALSALYGFAISAEMIGGRNFLYNICTYENRPAYVSIANTIIIPVTALSPLINGLLFDTLGFRNMCYLNLFVLLSGIFLLFRVKESVCLKN